MVISVNNFQHIADGANYTPPGSSSNNRLLVIVPCYRSGQKITIDGVTVGGNAATALSAYDTTTALGIDMITGVWYIKEANIPSGASVVDVAGTDNEGAGIGDDITSRLTCSVFTLYDFDQSSTPYIENPASQETDGGVGNQLISNAYGSNSGKFAMGVVMSSGSISEAYTITSNLGDLVSQGSNDTLASVYTLIAVNYRAVKIDSLASNSESTQFTVDFASSGSSGDGAMLNIAYALVFDEASNTAITIDQTTIEPGGTISGTYSGFTPGTAPTSPLVLTDSNSNTLNVTVTVNDSAGDGTGTFTGTVPNLPATGNTGSFLLFGNVTATLDDA